MRPSRPPCAPCGTLDTPHTYRMVLKQYRKTGKGRQEHTTMLRSERGQGLAEYALICVLVVLVVIAAVTLFGGAIAGFITNVSAAL
jgi:Flp pilus assembly pilin Flp